MTVSPWEYVVIFVKDVSAYQTFVYMAEEATDSQCIIERFTFLSAKFKKFRTRIRKHALKISIWVWASAGNKHFFIEFIFITLLLVLKFEHLCGSLEEFGIPSSLTNLIPNFR